MAVSHPLLTRRPPRPVPMLSLLPGAADVHFTRGRAHEACGPSRRTLAMWIAARTNGPVIWIVPSWEKDRLNSDGLSMWINPSRLLFVAPKRGEDVLWTMEESLRSGAVELVIADLPDLPNLTQVRRLHLAAETGTRGEQNAPLGLLLTPGKSGAPGVETRWHLSPSHRRREQCWELERLRARTAAPKIWHIRCAPGPGPGTIQIKSA